MPSTTTPFFVPIYDYQNTHRYFAQIADGLEPLGAQELAELGATDIATTFRGLFFHADTPALYRIIYQSRLITRVNAPLISFACHATKYLYKRARAINWSDFMKVHQTFAVFSHVSGSAINNSHYASLCLKDAIVDFFRDKTGTRPNVDAKTPDVWFHLHIRENHATISLELSGGSLHRRGYRQESVDAPMQETVAAAVVRLSQWTGTTPLCDPMCGSGTLLCEAVMHARHMPAGYLRNHFGFEHMPEFSPTIWKRVKSEADSKIIDLPSGLVRGNDRDPRAIHATRTNLNVLGAATQVVLTTRDVRSIPDLSGTTIITNPPYGIRLGKEEELKKFYKDLGDFLKKRCLDSTAYIYCGNRELIKSIGLRTSFKKAIKSGGLDGRLIKIAIYATSPKASKPPTR
ncbi:THUMP domain-containing class I SAM-dependent RNA methyltransferase [Desulfoplanes formicivorans]|uniref:THUMP domain-containing class I SAM-dependent RNA methyltransferase n=1 Tax=Desulfoplanes formicivorans TaxID=1592317 RepID=UPI000B1E80F6|nr:THUMP domain-containing protein [Desulfoplanes formicivorans]